MFSNTFEDILDIIWVFSEDCRVFKMFLTNFLKLFNEILILRPEWILDKKKILLMNSSLYGQSGLCSCLLFSGNFIEVNNYIQLFIFGYLINFPLNTFIGPVPKGYAMTPSEVCILLSSFAIRAILLLKYILYLTSEPSEY